MDFVILGAAVLFALIGLVRGGAKMFFGLFMLLIIMVGAAFISSAICPLILKSEKEDGSVEYHSAATVLMEPLSGVIPADMVGDFVDEPVVKGEDGALYVGEKKLADAIGEGIPYVGTTIAPFVVKAAHPGETLRTTIAFKMTEYIYETALWVILVIILAIIRNIIRKKIYRYLDHHSTQSKIDRLIGLVLNLVILVAILWGAGALLGYFDHNGASWATGANEFITSGTIAKPFMEFNPLLKLLGITGGGAA